MPNRVIKETVCTSEEINALTWFEEVLFYRLITACDDYGRMDGRIPILRARTFPLKDNVTNRMMSDGVAKLAELGILHLYEVDGLPYIAFVTWSKHQRFRNAREKYPAECEGSPQLAATRREMPQDAADGGSRGPAHAGAESESNPNPNPNPNPNTRRRTPPPPKTAYGVFENVFLTDEERMKLGPEAGDMIDRVSEYKASTGKKYASDYATILSWQRRDAGSPRAPVSGGGRPSNQLETFAELARKLERGEEI